MIDQRSTLHRRRLLLGAGTALLASTAGCTAVGNWIADQVLGDVNVFNPSDERVAGTIEIVGPDGETVLDESFDLEPEDDAENATAEDAGNDTGDDVAQEGGAVYDDVWDGAGTYEATVALAEGIEVRGDSEASASVTIDDPDEEMLAVTFGAAEFDDGIVFTTGTEWSEFHENPVE